LLLRFCSNLCYALNKVYSHTFAVINTNIFDNKNGIQLIESTANYDGEDKNVRLARREKKLDLKSQNCYSRINKN